MKMPTGQDKKTGNKGEQGGENCQNNDALENDQVEDHESEDDCQESD